MRRNSQTETEDGCQCADCPRESPITAPSCSCSRGDGPDQLERAGRPTGERCAAEDRTHPLPHFSAVARRC
uniref:Uncharacterized protein n=1 Tax=Setaria digitata TaxID=48799 RepID=A0A915PRJ8_9BILA